MPNDDSTPSGDCTPVPARTPASPRQSFANRERARQAKKAQSHAHEAAKAAGVRQARARERAAGKALPGSGDSRQVGGAIHMSMPSSVPILHPDTVRDPDRFGVGVDLDLGEGVALVEPASVAPTTGGRMHTIVETMFNSVAVALYEHGWCPIPQKHLMGKRGPEGGIEYSQFRDHCPTLPMVEQWCALYPSSNAAILLGAASHHAFALDLDIEWDHPLYPEMAAVIREHFGEHFIRFGSKGSVVILRSAPDVVVRNLTLRFEQAEGEDESPGMVEVLGHGSLVTAFGHHHKTGDYIKWGGLMPIYASPLRAPLVSPAELEACLRDLGKVRAYASSRAGGSKGCSVDPSIVLEYASVPDVPGAYVPRLPLDGSVGVIKDGRIVDGRRSAILALSMGVVCGNGHVIQADREDQRWPGILKAAVAHLHDVVAPGGARSRADLERTFLTQVRKDVERLRSTGPAALKPWRLVKRADGTMCKPARYDANTPRDPALSWLGGRDPVAGVATKLKDKDKGRLPTVNILQVDPPTAEKVVERALQADRTAVRKQMAEELRTALSGFFGAPKGMNIVIVPTGGGKSTVTAEYIYANARRFPRAFADDDSGPIAVLMPNHATIDEGAIVAERNGATFLEYKDDEEPGEQSHIAKAAVEARARGVKALHWTSKVNAGCERADEVAALAKAQVSSAGLCRSEAVAENGVEVERDSKGKPVYIPCLAREYCGYQRMVKLLAEADVVYMSHWWLTNKVPKGLRNPRMVIIDESVAFQMLRCAFLPHSILTEKRPDPHMRREELKETAEISRKRNAPTQLDLIRDRVACMHRDRDKAVQIVDAGRASGRCPAEALREHPRGRDLLKAARRLSGDARSAGISVHVRSTSDEIKALCTAAKSSHAALELRFWSIVEERMDALDKEEAAGPREMRLQWIKPNGSDAWGWRVSWTATPNWPKIPTLMLDATAEKEVTAAMFPSHGEPVVHQISASLNTRVVGIVDRSYSPSSFIPRPTGDAKADAAARKRAAELKRDVLAFVFQTCAAHPEGQVLVTTNKVLEDLLFKEFDDAGKLPGNLATAHYGALRGIDRWREARAVIMIGRSEMPGWLIDGYVAALTFKTAPEEPYDRSGEGLTLEGRPLFRPREARPVQMRDGTDLHVPVAEMPSRMAAAIERLWRESELLQALGRSRPIHRPDVADIIWMTDVVVDSVVYDDLLTLPQARAGGNAIDTTLGRTKGIVQAGLTGLPGTAEYIAARVPAERASGWRTVTWMGPTGHVVGGIAAGWVTDVRATLIDLGVPEGQLADLHVSEPSIPFCPWPEQPVAVTPPEPEGPEPAPVPEVAPAIAKVEPAQEIDAVKRLLADIFPGAGIVSVRPLAEVPEADPGLREPEPAD